MAMSSLYIPNFLDSLKDSSDDAAAATVDDLNTLALPMPPPSLPAGYPTALVPPSGPPYQPWDDPRHALGPKPQYKPTFVPQHLAQIHQQQQHFGGQPLPTPPPPSSSSQSSQQLPTPTSISGDFAPLGSVTATSSTPSAATSSIPSSSAAPTTSAGISSQYLSSSGMSNGMTNGTGTTTSSANSSRVGTPNGSSSGPSSVMYQTSNPSSHSQSQSQQQQHLAHALNHAANSMSHVGNYTNASISSNNNHGGHSNSNNNSVSMAQAHAHAAQAQAHAHAQAQAAQVAAAAQAAAVQAQAAAAAAHAQMNPSAYSPHHVYQQPQSPHQQHQQLQQQQQHLAAQNAALMQPYLVSNGGGPHQTYSPYHQASYHPYAHHQQQQQQQQQQQHQQNAYQQQQQQLHPYYQQLQGGSPISVPVFRPSNFPIHSIRRNNSSPYAQPIGSPSKRASNHVPSRVPAAVNPPRKGLYEATYSNVPVYEMVAPNGVGVMRRRHDAWMNATHVLKAAGMEKSRRTKVLEREIHQGEHEKIQGGYGKYQGTWIPLYRARELAVEYGLGESLRDILDLPE